ncbi:MAG: metallophosphoesterase [Candidatus Omnitrophota bacterium]
MRFSSIRGLSRASVTLALLLSIFAVRPCFADFKFAFISDTQGHDEDGVNDDVLAAVMGRIKSEGVDFILVGGDMVSGTAHTREHANQLSGWKKAMSKYKIPFYAAASNHVIQSETSERVFRSVFEMPQNGPAVLKELVYSFSHDNAHFISIDTEEYGNFHNIGKKQFAWLRRDLKKNRKKVVFVFGHDPAFPVRSHVGGSLDRFPEKRDELWALFRDHDVEAYLCGHEHLYNKSARDGVYQIIAGGAGGGLVAAPENGGFHHYVVVNVKDSGECEVTVKDIDGVVKDSFVLQ